MTRRKLRFEFVVDLPDVCSLSEFSRIADFVEGGLSALFGKKLYTSPGAYLHPNAKVQILYGARENINRDGSSRGAKRGRAGR